METVPTIETVLQALNILYSFEHIDGKEKASIWLGELQKSTYAWQIADQLLRLNISLESCYFASQTMRSKIQYSFHELPISLHESLKNSLLNHCKCVDCNTPPIITTQLCLALSDLVLQMPTWSDALEDCLAQFGTSEQHWIFLLEILTIFPEEVNSRSLKLGANRRNEMFSKMGKLSCVVLQFMTEVLKKFDSDERYIQQTLNCLSSWISGSLLTHDLFISNNILHLPFNILQDHKSSNFLHKAASDCVCATMMFLQFDRDISLLNTMLDQVVSLAPAYECDRAADEVDRLINFSHIFTETCENFMHEIFSCKNEKVMPLLDLLFNCLANENYEVSDTTFTFWIQMSEVLSEEHMLPVCGEMKHTIYKLLDILKNQSRLNESHVHPSDLSSNLSDMRRHCFELTSDVAHIVGCEDLFIKMHNNLMEVQNSWSESEACLFMMTAIIDKIVILDSTAISRVLDKLLNEGMNLHVCLQYTFIGFLGQLSSWISANHQYIEPTIKLLLDCLLVKDLSTRSCSTLERMTSCCAVHILPMFTHLLTILQSADHLQLKNNAILSLLKSIVNLVNLMPLDDVSVNVDHLCTLQINSLNQVLTNMEIQYCNPIVWLDRLAAIFSTLDLKLIDENVHPCQLTVDKIWLTITKLFAKYGADTNVIERCCRCLRFVLKCLQKYSMIYIKSIIIEIVDLYKQYKHSCCLYLGSILVDEYTTYPSCVPSLLEMLQELIDTSLKFLNDKNNFKYHPDVVDDLFKLASRFVQRLPNDFVSCSCTNSLMKCAVEACCLDHRDANESTSTFMIHCIQLSSNHSESGNNMFQRLKVDHGQDIVNHIVKAVCFCITSYDIMGHLSNVIYQLILMDRLLTMKWLQETFKYLPAHAITNDQMNELCNILNKAEDLKTITAAIKDFAKLFR